MRNKKELYEMMQLLLDRIVECEGIQEMADGAEQMMNIVKFSNGDISLDSLLSNADYLAEVLAKTRGD